MSPFSDRSQRAPPNLHMHVTEPELTGSGLAARLHATAASRWQEGRRGPARPTTERVARSPPPGARQGLQLAGSWSLSACECLQRPKTGLRHCDGTTRCQVLGADHAGSTSDPVATIVATAHEEQHPTRSPSGRAHVSIRSSFRSACERQRREVVTNCTCSTNAHVRGRFRGAPGSVRLLLVMSTSGVRFPVPAPTRKPSLTRQNVDLAMSSPVDVGVVSVNHDTVVTQQDLLIGDERIARIPRPMWARREPMRLDEWARPRSPPSGRTCCGWPARW